MGTLAVILQILLLLVGTFMILIILLQRGRGGGLAGAFGGTGGQSAFGTKAGDVFTRITVVLATVWVLLAGFSGLAMRAASTPLSDRLPEGTTSVQGVEGESSDATGTGADATIPDFPGDLSLPPVTPEAGSTATPPASTLPVLSTPVTPATEAPAASAPVTPPVETPPALPESPASAVPTAPATSAPVEPPAGDAPVATPVPDAAAPVPAAETTPPAENGN